MKLESGTIEETGVLETARRMCIAARTAPKARGFDELVTLVLTGEEKDAVAARMQELGEQDEKRKFFVRDAGCLRKSRALVLIGTKVTYRGIPYCGYCGFSGCDENRSHGGVCAYSASDLGIAVGSAASVAADSRVDCRVMFSAGRTAMDLGLFESGVRLAFGIPLSVSGKSPFFDR